MLSHKLAQLIAFGLQDGSFRVQTRAFTFLAPPVLAIRMRCDYRETGGVINLDFIMDQKKILIIDDEFPIRYLVEYQLRRNGFQVVSAKDGPSGLEAARTQKPDLIDRKSVV